MLPDEEYKHLSGHFTMLLCLVPALRELTTHGTKSFQTSLQRIESAASLGSTSRARKEVLASTEWEELHRALAVLEFSGAHTVHPKLFKLKEV
jgi:ERCC4-related helicase